jgi:6-phosphogluconate dehydrogenase
VHNGIEYAVMQLIAETYHLLQRGSAWNNDELADQFNWWNQGPLSSYLIEITGQIFQKVDPDTGRRLVDMVKDVARQKGTGKWTSQDALDLVVPIPTIDAAVAERELSDCVAERAGINAAYPPPPGLLPPSHERRRVKGEGSVESRMERALHAATIIAYAQGLDLLRKASSAYGYQLQLGEVAKIWRGGCIIRASLLEDIRAAYQAKPDLSSLLLAPRIVDLLGKEIADLRSTVKLAVDLGLPAPALMTALAYFDSLRCGKLPTNLIQAQRDFFGAHTYERTDKEGTFHSQWDS